MNLSYYKQRNADSNKAAREAFAQFDTNCNNCLDYHEFGKFLKSCDVPESMQATNSLRQIWRIISRDGCRVLQTESQRRSVVFDFVLSPNKIEVVVAEAVPYSGDENDCLCEVSQTEMNWTSVVALIPLRVGSFSPWGPVLAKGYCNPFNSGAVDVAFSPDAANYYSTTTGHKQGETRMAGELICSQIHPGSNATMWSKGSAWCMV